MVNQSIDVALKIQDKMDNLVFINLDAQNAFNNLSNFYTWEILYKMSPILANWFRFLYNSPFKVDWDESNAILFANGFIQGLSSSNIFYSAAKWKIEKQIFTEMVKITNNQFSILFKTDYVDDGLNLFDYLYIGDYIDCAIKFYKMANIDINKSKSTIIAKTQNKRIRNSITNDCTDNKGIKLINYNFDGNIEYCGVPHGTDEFVNEFMDKFINKLNIKINNVELIVDEFIKYNIIKKFYIYNKVVYILRMVRLCGSWLHDLQQLHNKLELILLNGVNFTNTLQFQTQISQSEGGWGLRSPKMFVNAAKVAAYTGKRIVIARHFTFHGFFNDSVIKQLNLNTIDNDDENSESKQAIEILSNINMVGDVLTEKFKIGSDLELITRKYNDLLFNNNMGELIKFNMVYSDKIKSYFDEINNCINTFNDQIGENMEYNPHIHDTHKKLIKLIDYNLKAQMEESGDIYDIVRMKGLDNNGAQSWLNVPYNFSYGQEFTNAEFTLLKQFICGSTITVKENLKCVLCKEKLDKYGIHALSCDFDGLENTRHDALCDYICVLCKETNIEYEKEARFEDMVNLKNRIKERPGDIKLINYLKNADIEDGNRDVYIDVTVCNILKKSYLVNASKRRAYYANDKETHKHKKYRDKIEQGGFNFMGFGVEIFGGLSKNVKLFFQEIAKRMELKDGIDRSVHMNRIRSNFIAILMKQNVRMIKKCYNL